MDSEKRPDEVPQDLQFDQPSNCPKCWYCESDDLTSGLELGLSAEPGQVGIPFNSTGKFLGVSLLGNEPIGVTLCNECGTIVRLSINHTGRNWFTR